MAVRQLAAYGRLLGNSRPFWRERRIDWQLFPDGRCERCERIVACPNLERSSAPAPLLCVDNAEYVFGIVEKDEARAMKRHTMFLSLMRECAQATGLGQFLEAAETIARIASPVGMLPKDLVGIVDANGEWLHDLPGVEKFWRGRCASAYSGRESTCLSCGQVRQCVRVVPFGIGPRGGLDGAIVSSNHNCTNAHGHVQAGSFPLCLDCAANAAHAANTMLSKDEHHWKLGDTVFLFWVDSQGPNAISDLVRSGDRTKILEVFGDDPDTGDLRAVLRGVFDGHQAADIGDGRFQFLGLRQQGKGRVSVVMEGSAPLSEVRRSVAEWFLAQEDVCGKTMSLWQIQQALVAWRKDKELPRRIQQHLVSIAFFGQRPADWLMRQALRTMGKQARRGEPICPQAFALVELWRRRNGMPENKDAFECGRLMAVIERAQLKYHEGHVPNRTLADRNIVDFAQHPARTVEKLMPVVQVLLSKLGRNVSSKKHAYWISKDISDILSGMSNGVPQRLAPGDQAAFWRGYYSQRGVSRKTTGTQEKEMENEENETGAGSGEED